MTFAEVAYENSFLCDHSSAKARRRGRLSMLREHSMHQSQRQEEEGGSRSRLG
jgi:hypothetical protein